MSLMKKYSDILLMKKYAEQFTDNQGANTLLMKDCRHVTVQVQGTCAYASIKALPHPPASLV